MNKHFYRIVFNAARGLRMVVQESARSTGKGASRSTRGAAVGATIGLFGALVAAGANAQIIADPNAPANQRPPVLVAPSGVPLVNIQTPTAGGVSRNTYRQFDVDGKGAILNNSRSNVQTQLGGWVQGNPFLGRGPARIILNEVNSSNPSHLRGVVEVAGQRAEVIIANPSGISVDGAGFINAAGVTLTTGTPQFNSAGSLESFLVRGGTITVEGAGLDASNLDYAAILSRALQVNAGIWAKDLKVVTGANEVSADASKATPVAGSGAAPTFALDVAQLGGMYANKIKLIGTEAGVGVRNAGSIGAGAGELVVTSSGRLENRGTLEAARVQLAAATELDNSGGTIRQTGGALTVAAANLSNRNGGVIGAEPVPAAPSAGDGGAAPAPQGGTPGVDSAATSPNAGAADGGAPAQPSAPLLPGLITAETVRNDGGRIHAGDVTLETPQIDNSGGTLAVKQLAVSGDRFANNGGTLNVRDTFSAQVGGFAQVAQREFQPGTSFRAENINAGQAVDRDGLPRVGGAKDRSEAQLSDQLGHRPEYWGTANPAWKEGTVVKDRITTEPEKYRMVIDQKQHDNMQKALAKGDSEAAAKELGGWATKDPINSMADVRGSLAISNDFKPTSSGQVLYAVEFEVKPGVGLREGTVGPMWDPATQRVLPGGGSQVNFMSGTMRTNPGNFVINQNSLKALK